MRVIPLHLRPCSLGCDEHGPFWRFEMENGWFFTIDQPDREILGDHKWFVFRRRAHLRYVARSENGLVLLHREIMQPKPYPIETVDHENGNGLNNRRYNLRIASRQQNRANQRVSRGTSSGFRGVYPKGSRWQALISVGDKLRGLGTFADPAEAARAYDAAAIAGRGKFTYLNFPNA